VIEHDIKDLKLAPAGRKRIEWAGSFMPVLSSIRERLSKSKPFKRIRISCCLHVTSETANLIIALKSGGADVRLCASNPLSTQDDVAASLVRHFGVPVFAVKGENRTAYYSHIDSAIKHEPHITTDDGADLVSTLHSKRRSLIKGVLGGTEETTTGVIRLKSMERDGVLEYPIVAVNDSQTKFMFDNRYGTGQSSLDGILRATNILFAGSTVVICGYGWCGRGVAAKACGLGADVIVTEVDAIKALEARMDGYRVMRLIDACREGDVFITVTGDINVVDRHHMLAMKDGAIVCNSGHFDVEVNKAALSELTGKKRELRRFCVEHKLVNGRRLVLLAEARLINLSAAEGHPAMVMDMSFANQALAVEYILNNSSRLAKRVYKLPSELDERIARMKLRTLGVRIDTLTEEQKEYISSWKAGT
jgi:adenosylhomocysteinase